MLRPQFIVLAIALLAGLIVGSANFSKSQIAQQQVRQRKTSGVNDVSSITESQSANSPPQFASTSLGTTADALAPALESLSAQDIELLKQLPPACTAEIPGITDSQTIPDHSKFEPPTENTWNSQVSAEESSSTFETAAISNAVNEPAALPIAFEHASVSSLQPIETPVAHADVNSTAATADPHAEVYAQSQFPSAAECAKCHQQIYDEWSTSSHAYASISPMFHRFEDTINKLTSGTIGYFCMRCHAPVATTMEHPRDQAIYDGPRVFREGVTCVACHRVNEAYTKSNGERRIEPGDIFEPVYGGGDGAGNETAVTYKDFFKVKTNAADTNTAQSIHASAFHFEQLTQSDFCMSCHQVSVPPGIKLEVVWDQYRASPAYRAGVTCQDCHMGRVPGINAGYSEGPAAVIVDRVVNPKRKHSNHAFYGPGSSIAHPGIFPLTSPNERWTPEQWLQFDWRSGWGTEEYERQITEGKIQISFPETWGNVDDRFDAREIITANLKKLDYKKDLRRQVMENGSKIDGPTFTRTPEVGSPLEFEYCVTNLNPGHNLPSGSLGAQPQLWLNVVLIGPDGQRIWETGYLDSTGDLADIHSKDVACGRVPFDRQLFNLQTKFLTTNVKGTDREMYLPLNFDIDQLPFIRPAGQPITVLNHPPLARMEAHSLPPLGSRLAKYKIPADLISAPGTYRLSVRMRSRMEPVYFMEFCGSTPEMIRAMTESILDIHPYSVAFHVQ